MPENKTYRFARLSAVFNFYRHRVLETVTLSVIRCKGSGTTPLLRKVSREWTEYHTTEIE